MVSFKKQRKFFLLDVSINPIKPLKKKKDKREAVLRARFLFLQVILKTLDLSLSLFDEFLVFLWLRLNLCV